VKNVQVAAAPLHSSAAPVLRSSEAAVASAECAAPGVDDAPTRERVARSILENGPSTAAALAERLTLTPAAVRRHLDQLVAVGALEAREPRIQGARGRGRPARVFLLTDSGRDTFLQAYDDLAARALRFVRDSGGAEAVTEFARLRTADIEDRFRSRVGSADPDDRVHALADALTADGYAASVRSTSVGDQICQHHCPVAHVAAEFPQLCEAETEVFARLLGRHVQRLATIAHGDGICTTYVPRPVSDTVPRPLSTAREPTCHPSSS
jgi:predicted ArsR family transcriptional regulator